MRQHDRITRQNGLDTGFERHAEGEIRGEGTTTSLRYGEMSQWGEMEQDQGGKNKKMK